MFCTDGAATVIKSYSPELIVHPYLPDEGAYEAKCANAASVRSVRPPQCRHATDVSPPVT